MHLGFPSISQASHCNLQRKNWIYRPEKFKSLELRINLVIHLVLRRASLFEWWQATKENNQMYQYYKLKYILFK
jgi:hypothetical protein